MRITAETVRVISAYAGLLSDGYVTEVGVTVSGDRIMDGQSQTAWVAQPRQAAAYYLGQVGGYAAARGMTPADLPDDVQAIRDAVLTSEQLPPSVLEWYGTGLDDAVSRTRRYCPEIRCAGKP